MSLARSLSWVATAQGLSVLIQFAGTVVLARYLTPHETGIYAVGLATVGILSLVQALGLQALIVREEVLTDETMATAFTVNALIAVFLSVATISISLGVGDFLGDAGVSRVMLALAALPLIGIFTFLPTSMLERSRRFKELSQIGTVSLIATTLCSILFAMSGFSYMSIAYAQLIGSTLSATLLLIVGREHASLRVGFFAWRRVADFGLQMLAVTGINAVSSRLSEIALARLIDLSALGVYSRASGVNGIIWNNIHIAASRVMLADYSAIRRADGDLRERYLRTIDIVTATLWPTFAGLALLAKPLILVVYGENWLRAATPLALFSIASIGLVAISMTWEIFAATGNLRTQTKIEFKRTLISFAAFLLGCLISLEAAAASRVLDAVVALFLYRPHLNRMTNTSMADLGPIYIRNGLLTLLAIAPAAGLMIAYRMSAAVPILDLCGAVIGGALLWSVALFLTRHSLSQEMIRIAKGRVYSARRIPDRK